MRNSPKINKRKKLQAHIRNLCAFIFGKQTWTKSLGKRSKSMLRTRISFFWTTFEVWNVTTFTIQKRTCWKGEFPKQTKAHVGKPMSPRALSRALPWRRRLFRMWSQRHIQTHFGVPSGVQARINKTGTLGVWTIQHQTIDLSGFVNYRFANQTARL